MSWIQEIRDQFPQIQEMGDRLVYLDSAATALKLRTVIEAMETHMRAGAANVHRGAHRLSDAATLAFEDVRGQIARFLRATSPEEIIFTHGTTESINLVASSYSRTLKAGDEIILSRMEHHSNIVPWYLAAQEHDLKLKFVPITSAGELDLSAFENLLTERTRVVALSHLSNALGTVNNLQPFIEAAHGVGAVVLVDAAQSVVSLLDDVQEMDCDFLAFSGHKMYGPTGVGVLYGKKSLLEKMPPFMGGGSMISTVTEEHIDFLPPPHRFEAGTPPIAEVIALGEAIRFLSHLDRSQAAAQDHDVLKLAVDGLRSIEGVTVYAPDVSRSHIVSFNLDGAHPSDVGALLDEQGVGVRTGHHCCQPLMKALGVPGTVRASFSVYSTTDEVERLISAVQKAKKILS